MSAQAIIMQTKLSFDWLISTEAQTRLSSQKGLMWQDSKLGQLAPIWNWRKICGQSKGLRYMHQPRKEQRNSYHHIASVPSDTNANYRFCPLHLKERLPIMNLFAKQVVKAHRSLWLFYSWFLSGSLIC